MPEKICLPKMWSSALQVSLSLAIETARTRECHLCILFTPVQHLFQWLICVLACRGGWSRAGPQEAMSAQPLCPTEGGCWAAAARAHRAGEWQLLGMGSCRGCGGCCCCQIRRLPAQPRTCSWGAAAAVLISGREMRRTQSKKQQHRSQVWRQGMASPPDC